MAFLFTGPKFLLVGGGATGQAAGDMAGMGPVVVGFLTARQFHLGMSLMKQDT